MSRSTCCKALEEEEEEEEEEELASCAGIENEHVDSDYDGAR